MKAKKRKTCRFYVDGVRMAGDVLKMALNEYVALDDMKKALVERYKGHDVTFAVE